MNLCSSQFHLGRFYMSRMKVVIGIRILKRTSKQGKIRRLHSPLCSRKSANHLQQKLNLLSISSHTAHNSKGHLMDCYQPTSFQTSKNWFQELSKGFQIQYHRRALHSQQQKDLYYHGTPDTIQGQPHFHCFHRKRKCLDDWLASKRSLGLQGQLHGGSSGL